MPSSRPFVPALLVAWALPLLAAVPGGGDTELIRKDLAALSREAELVVVADVVSNRASWGPHRRLIWTTTVLEVVASWKGAAPERLALSELGGVVDDVGMKVPGAPRYREGERVLVFLKRDVLGRWRTHGWTQGRFSVTRSKAGSRATAAHPHVLAGRFSPAQVAGSAPVALADLEAQVRALAVGVPNRRAGGGKEGK